MSVPEAPSHVAGNVPGPSLLPTVTSDTTPLVAADDVPTAHDTPQDAQPGVSSIPVTESTALPDSALAASQPEPPAPTPQTAQVLLCFLLVSGRRRNMTFDPETTVGRVKELVWNAWPAGKSSRFTALHAVSFDHPSMPMLLGHLSICINSHNFYSFYKSLFIRLGRLARRASTRSIFPPNTASRQDTSR